MEEVDGGYYKGEKKNLRSKKKKKIKSFFSCSEKSALHKTLL